MADLQKNSQNSEMHYGHDTLTIQCIYPSASKLIIDKIDTLLSQHYGFTEEELDFIIKLRHQVSHGRGHRGRRGMI